MYNYQTFIASLIALASALTTILVMRHHHNDLLVRKNLAAKAHMHDAAKAICEYAQLKFNCFWTEFLESNARPEDYTRPDNAIRVLSDNIGYLDIESAKAISNLLSKYQIFHSRLRTLDENRNHKLKQHLVELIELNALAARIFEYARNNSLTIKNHDASSQEIHSSFRNMKTNYYGFGRAYSVPVDLNSDIEDRINSMFESE